MSRTFLIALLVLILAAIIALIVTGKNIWDALPFPLVYTPAPLYGPGEL